MVGKKKDNDHEREEGIEKKSQTIFPFFLKKKSRLMKGILRFYFCNCTLYAKSQIFFIKGT